MDLFYAYGQLPLSADTSVQCNFSLVGESQRVRTVSKRGFTGLQQGQLSAGDQWTEFSPNFRTGMRS